MQKHIVVYATELSQVKHTPLIRHVIMLLLICHMFKKRYWLIKYVGRLLIWLYFIYFRYASKNYGLVMTRQALTAPMIAIWTEFLSRAVGRFGMFTIVAAFPSVSAVTELYIQYHLSTHKAASYFYTRNKKMKVTRPQNSS